MDRNMDKIGFGLIGAGVIGQVHARNIASRADAMLHWIVDTDAARARALATACGARFGVSVEEMLADPAVQAVVVGSSTAAHEAHVLASIAAGKAILCEKPISDSLDGARRCLDAARTAGAVAAVGFNRRFDVHHRAVHDRVRAGEIGAVESMHFVSRSSAAPSPAASHRSGGMLRDKGTHHYDLACWIAGVAPVEVYATGGCLFEPGYAEYGDVDSAALTLRFETGALATFSFSRRTAYGCDEMFDVFGAGGLLVSERQRERGVCVYRGTQLHADGIHAGWYERFAPTYAAELDALIGAIRGGHAASPGLDDGLRAQAIAEAAVESLASGRPAAIRDVWSA